MSISQKVLNGSLWSLAITFITRIIGIASTLILIRVLSPNDFGIAALATMVMFLFMSLCELGIRQYIIKTPNISDDIVNSAWSLQIIINLIISISLFIFSPFIAILLENEVISDVLRVIAFIPFIAALNNPGAILLEKALDYNRLSKITISAKLLSAPITVGIALIYKSYWALVIGQLVSIMVICIFSYVFINHRPKFRFKDFSHILSMTKWLLIGSLTGFIRAKIESLIINSKFGAEGVGLYDTSKEFSLLPLTDIIGPASAPLLAGVSSINTGLQDTYKAVVKYLYIAMFFIIPTIVGIFIVGDLFVDVVMGEKWLKAIPLFKLVSLLMIVFCLYTCCRIIMFLSDDLKILTIMDVVSIIVMLAFLLPSYVDSLEFLAWGRIIIGLLFALALVSTLHFRYKMKVKPIFTLFITVFLLCVPFAVSIYLLKPLLLDHGVAITLVITGVLGGIIYLGTVFFSIRTLAKQNEYFLFTKEFIENNVNSVKRKCTGLLSK